MTLIAYPREEPDLDQFVQALIAMAVDRLTIEKRQARRDQASAGTQNEIATFLDGYP